MRQLSTPDGLRRLATGRTARRVTGSLTTIAAIAISALTIRHLSAEGWPLDDAHPQLVGISGGFFLLAYAFKAYGWQQLFAPTHRPTPMVLAAAGGAASITGAALPGRFDDVVRVAVVRRFWSSHPGLSVVCLSLFTLGLIDTAALLPFSAAAAVTSDGSVGTRAALAVVSVAGVGAAVIVAMLPRIARSQRLGKFRLVRWLSTHATSHREAGQAALFVGASWAVRAVGLFFLLSGLGVTISFPLAIAFLCASAASSALPIAPAGGAVTQAGAGAAMLAASGVPLAQAVAFSIAAQALFILAGAAVVTFAAAWHGGRRVAAAYAYARA